MQTDEFVVMRSVGLVVLSRKGVGSPVLRLEFGVEVEELNYVLEDPFLVLNSLHDHSVEQIIVHVVESRNVVESHFKSMNPIKLRLFSLVVEFSVRISFIYFSQKEAFQCLLNRILLSSSLRFDFLVLKCFLENIRIQRDAINWKSVFWGCFRRRELRDRLFLFLWEVDDDCKRPVLDIKEVLSCDCVLGLPHAHPHVFHREEAGTFFVVHQLACWVLDLRGLLL